MSPYQHNANVYIGQIGTKNFFTVVWPLPVCVRRCERSPERLCGRERWVHRGSSGAVSSGPEESVFFAVTSNVPRRLHVIRRALWTIVFNFVNG